MTFRVGQKIVCIDDSNCTCGKPSGLILRDVYTVVWTSSYFGEPVVHLAEYQDMEGHSGALASRFRPLVEKKTDISIFKKMLTPSDERIDA